jgi:hypothetical protein
MIQNRLEPPLFVNQAELTDEPDTSRPCQLRALNILIREFPDKGELQRAQHEHSG